MILSSTRHFFSLPAFAIFPTRVRDHATGADVFILFHFYRQGYIFDWKSGLWNLYYETYHSDQWDKYLQVTEKS
jgi:hypothetical protein